MPTGTSVREEASVFVPLTRSRLALLVLLLGAVIAVWPARPDPRLVQARLAQQRLNSDEIRRLTPEQQRQLRSQLQSEVKELSPDQRRILGEESRRLLIEKIDRYRALPRVEQVAFLDEEIDRLIALQRDQESAAGKRGAHDHGKTGSGRGRAPGANADERERYLKQQLDASTPEQRAKLGDLVKQLVDRAKERGLLGADFPDDLHAVLALIQ
jgi:hypothetical protein